MQRPVCVQCGIEMISEENGVLVYHPQERPNPAPAFEQRNGMNIINTDQLMEINEGNIDFIVLGDLFSCEKCGHKVITNFGKRIVDYVDASQEELKRMVATHPYTIEILRKEVKTR